MNKKKNKILTKTFKELIDVNNTIIKIWTRNHNLKKLVEEKLLIKENLGEESDQEVLFEENLSLKTAILAYKMMIEDFNKKSDLEKSVQENLSLVKTNIEIKSFLESKKIILFHNELIIRLCDLTGLLFKKIGLLFKKIDMKKMKVVTPNSQDKENFRKAQEINANENVEYYFSSDKVEDINTVTFDEIKTTKFKFLSYKYHNTIEEIDEDIELLNNQIIILEEANELKGQEEEMEICP